jgi:hypothetical protein
MRPAFTEETRQLLGAAAEGAPARFVETARACFEKAAQAAGGVEERMVRVGEHRVLLRFAGGQLIALVARALAHREIPLDGKADLTVCFFDSESTRTPMPPPPWSLEQFTGLGEIDGYNDERVHVTYGPGVDILQCLDRDRSLALYWTPSYRLIPWWEQTFPLWFILNWWLKDGAFQPLHAAAVGTASGGVLITGPGGSGKSTAALACLGCGLRYAGDDYVLVRTNPSPYVYSLYSTAKIKADNLHRFPHLAPIVSNTERLGSEKALIFLNEHCAAQLIEGFPIRAILTTKVSGLRDTTVEPATAMAALKALTPMTQHLLRGTRRQTLEKILRLVKSAPVYTLLAGTDLAQIPVTISGLLQKLETSD